MGVSLRIISLRGILQTSLVKIYLQAIEKLTEEGSTIGYHLPTRNIKGNSKE